MSLGLGPAHARALGARSRHHGGRQVRIVLMRHGRRADGVGSRPERAWPHRGIRNRRKNRLRLFTATRCAFAPSSRRSDCSFGHRGVRRRSAYRVGAPVAERRAGRYRNAADSVGRGCRYSSRHRPLAVAAEALALAVWSSACVRACRRLVLEAETEVAARTFDIVNVPE